MLKNDAPDFRRGNALPPFRPVSDAIRAALPALAPPARITVSQAALRRSINVGGNWQDWDNSVAPYMVEPMDQVTSRRFDSIVFAGPARCSKTEALVINPLAHAMLCAPRLVAIFHMVQASAREFSIQELDPIIRNSPELAARLSTAKGGDNTFDKRFAGGGRLTVDWPVPSKLAARSIPLVIFTDYDAHDQNIGGEGSGFDLGRKRTTSAGSRGMTIAESSPRFDIEDESWTPSTAHEAPKVKGILGLYNDGTRARWYWTCPDCGGEFEPTFERLHYPDEGTPLERGAAAYMSCLHCGSVIEAKQKAALNAGGRWLHENGEGKPVPLGDDVRRTSTLSYWLQGAAAALASWATIVSRYLTAVEDFEATGSHLKLKPAMNLDLGLPYRPRAMNEGEQVTEKGLRETLTDHAWQVAPAGTLFLLATVDVQPGRFVVAVHAHLPDLERVLIDRFDIITPPEGAARHGLRLDPAKYGEDWDALFDLAERSYPVANAQHALKIVAVACDRNGEAGVTPRAYDFWRRARIKYRGRFYLVAGKGGLNIPKRAELLTPETASKGKRHVARDTQYIRAASDLLKDELAASLLRKDSGARAYRIPKGAPAEVCAEFAAERRVSDGWEKRPGIKRNEAIDLAVYDAALALILKAEKLKADALPAWARPGADNAFAVPLSELVERAPDAEVIAEEIPAKPETKPRPRPRARQKRGRFDGW